MAAKNTTPNFLGMIWKSPTQSKWSKYHVAMTRRPRKEEQGVSGVDTFAEWNLPPHPIAYRDMYNLAKLQVNVRTSIKHLVWELVRRGVEWKPNWTAKCIDCNNVYNSVNEALPCPTCGGELIGPDPQEYKWADTKVKNANMNHQTLVSIIENISTDHHIADEGYMVIRKEYTFDDDGNIKMGRVKEILRGSPALLRPVANPKTGKIGWNMLVCPVHRENVIFDASDTSIPYHVDIPNSKVKKCKCGKMLYPVHYVTLKIEGGEPEDYYIEGEVINRHVYGTNLLYGTPPMLTLWPIAAALFYQETYIRDAFERKRIPNGALVVNTSNATGFLSFWKKNVLELKNDPHFIPVVPLETEVGATQQGRINFVKFMDSIKEMDYIATRDEFRQRIASFYGVSTMFMADTRQSGQGNLNEGSQLVVSSRSVERLQKVWNDYYLPRLSRALGVHNWTLQIRPTEDRDLLKDLQKEQLQLQVNQMYSTIGYVSEQDPYNGEWLHKKDYVTELQRHTQVLEMLMGVTGGGMGMEGGDVKGGGDDMQSYEPNTEKGYPMEKARHDGSPNTGNNTGSSAMKMKSDPRGNRPTSPGQRTNDAPGAIKKYKCKVCGEQFDSGKGLGGHMKSRHPGSGEQEDAMTGGEGLMEDEMMPDPDSLRNTLKIMEESEMFDTNIIDMMRGIVNGEYPQEEKVRQRGVGGKRATPAGSQRRRKYE